MARLSAVLFWVLALCRLLEAQAPANPGLPGAGAPAADQQGGSKVAPKTDNKKMKKTAAAGDKTEPGTSDGRGPVGNPAPTEDVDGNPAQQQRMPTTTFDIEPPQADDPLQSVWYGIMGVSCLAILVLGYAAWILSSGGAPRVAGLEVLEGQVQTVASRAVSARSQFTDLTRRLGRPAAPPPPKPAKEEHPTPRVEVPAQPVPREPSRGQNPVVSAYHQVRTSPGSAARDDFDNSYPYVRISCINHEEWRFDKTVTLRFRRDDYGWYLLVTGGGALQAFPWFTQDLAGEREAFEGVFRYPNAAGDGRLQLAQPARLTAQGDDWILSEPGVLETDV